MKTPLILLAIPALLAVLTAPAPAQQLGGNVPAGNVLYTVGTTFSAEGRDHAYLLWSPTDEDLLRLRAYSIWSKPGGPNSPAEYQPVSWIQVQTDPATIELTLLRAERLGQDLGKLEVAIDGLFEDIRPATGVPRSHKLSAILQGAQGDPAMFHNLLILSRLHPAVGLCMGSAYAGPITGPTTFEVRMAGPGDTPAAAEAARRVVGRVTLDPAAYQALPAPGPPVSVPFGKWNGDVFVPDVRASLNARMRWATPDALRQQSLLQFGYQVYRIDPAFYESQIQGTPLNSGDLAAFAEGFPDEVRRVNRHPVLIDKMFSFSQAADRVSDPDTAFIVDSNGLGEPGAPPFEDGQSFYYMVTAVDILGRDGHASPATEIFVYQLTPPAQPRQVAVEDYVTHPTPTTTRQEFRISWLPSPQVPGVQVARYEVFRWADQADIAKPIPAHPPILVGTATATPGATSYELTDASLGVPLPVSQYGKVHWFTVRAVAASAVADLGPVPGAPKSPHSAPASGVLQDRRTPQPPSELSAEVMIVEGRIQMSLATGAGGDLGSPDYGFLNCRITLARNNPAVNGIDCYARIDDTGATGETVPTPLGPAPLDAIYLGSVQFSEDAGQTSLPATLRIPVPPDKEDHSVTLHLRARDRHGNLTEFSTITLEVTTSTYHIRHQVNASIAYSYAQSLAGVTPPLKLHVARRADNGNVHRPEFHVSNLPGDVTWKIMRRIDDGQLELEAEGGGEQGLQLTAGTLSTNASEVSYFLQLISRNGIAGPLREFGRFRTSSLEPPSKPMLLPLETLPGQQATLRWVCSPHGVERFHIGVAGVGHLPGDSISTELSATFQTRAEKVRLDGKETTLDFRIYDTGALADLSPETSVTLDLEDGVTYHFFIQAVSANGERGRVSNAVSYGWIDPVDPGPDAPWPARRPAQINTEFTRPVASMEGIVVGSLPAGTSIVKSGETWQLRPPAGQPPPNLAECLHRGSSGAVEGARTDRALLPCVVYRYQVPNATFPRVSGDVVQVSPLIKGIAARTENLGGTNATVVYDPYFNFVSNRTNFYLMPPHPLIDRASYRYLMVLLADDGEIDSVVPTTIFLVNTTIN